MDEPTSHTWTCSACGRRVPQRVETCHCGGTRERSLAARRTSVVRQPQNAPLPPGWRGLWASLPRDVIAMVAAAALVVTSGLAWLLLAPQRPNTTPALLGYVDRRPQTPPSPPPPRPPFKLPWWK